MEIRPASIAQVRASKDGRNVLIEDDVLDVAKRLAEIDPDLRLRWSERGEHFTVYQQLGDTEKLVLTSKEMTPAIVERIRQIAHPSYDFAGELDRMDDQADKDADHAFAEKVGPYGERMAHAIRKDTEHKGKVFLPRDI